jgi:hypothetical protein
MHGDPIAILMATESTRRRLIEPPREARPRRPRRAAALALQAAAHRLDPYVARSPSQARRTAAG